MGDSHDATMIAVDPIAATDNTSQNHGQGDGRGEDAEKHNDDDEHRMRVLLRTAAKDPNQPSGNHSSVFGFSGKAAEEAYQAGQAPERVQGAMMAVWLGVMGNILFVVGNADTPAAQIGTRLPVIVLVVLALMILASLTIKMLQAWKPVKPCDLVYLTSCAMTSYLCLFLTMNLVLLVVEEGHAISKPNVLVYTTRAVLIPIVVISLLRPSPRLISATCTLSATQFGALSYYSSTFDTLGLAIVAGVYFSTTCHLIAFIFERASRVSFVHQLSATRQSEATPK